MMSEITAGININMSDVLFDVLTTLVSTPDKQSRGFCLSNKRAVGTAQGAS